MSHGYYEPPWSIIFLIRKSHVYVIQFYRSTHSSGVAECQLFLDCLYNFLGTGLPDPNLDPTYRNYNICSETTNSSDPSLLTNVALDFRSQFRWELSYFRNVKQKKGLLRIDNEIGTDPTSSPHFNRIASLNCLFNVAFINSLKKMNPIGVITDPALGNIWDQVCKIAIAPETIFTPLIPAGGGSLGR